MIKELKEAIANARAWTSPNQHCNQDLKLLISTCQKIVDRSESGVLPEEKKYCDTSKLPHGQSTISILCDEYVDGYNAYRDEMLLRQTRKDIK